MKLPVLLIEKRTEIGYILGIAVVAFLYRLFLMRYHFAIGWDEPHYLQLAAVFARGQFIQGFHPYWSPAYPICVAIVSFVSRNLEISGRVVSILFSVLTLFPFYFFTKDLFSKSCAYVSTILLAVYPPLAFSASLTLAEPELVFFLLMAIWMGWKTIKSQSILYSVITGLFFGFAYLSKPEGVGYFAVFLGISGIWVLTGHFGKNIRKLLVAIIVLISFLITASPYLIYLHQQTGQWTISSKVSANQQFEANAFADTYFEFWSLSEDNTRLPMDAIFHDGNLLQSQNRSDGSRGRMNINAVLKKYFTNLYRMLKYEVPQAFSLILFIFFLLGLLWNSTGQAERGIEGYLLIFIILFWFVIIPLFHINQRYMLPGFTLCFIWIGRGVLIFIGEMREYIKNTILLRKWSIVNQQSGPVISRILALCIILLPFGLEFGKIVTRNADSAEDWADAVELKEAGQWISERYSSGQPVLMSYNKAVDFYAGCYDIRKGASFSLDSFDRILDYARYRNVQYIVVSERDFGKFPNLKFLFHDDQIPEELELIYQNDRPSPSGVRIFHVRERIVR
jgi:4-amino-4-deoxy-L-arabinose transferase-like glycosyltransferase